MPIKDNTRTIRIDSIMGGQSGYVYPPMTNEFTSSYAIDPDLFVDNSLLTKSLGAISPRSVQNIGTTVSAPMWLVGNPKTSTVAVYDYSGSIYSISGTLVQSDLGDLNDGGNAFGNGAEYYDNYIYFARSTTIARYGPLDGTAIFTDDYWVSTLGKTALSATQYPFHSGALIRLPNHVMLRHTDGRLYFVDVVGNQGYIHYIKTAKTTVEGDTDNGSTYQALDFPYGMWPTAIASYGSDIAVALYEGPYGDHSRTNVHSVVGKRAKLSFWDTTSADYNKITEVEFPDEVIYALLNSNGVLYAFSGQCGDGLSQNKGVRVSRFAGGYSFEEVAYIDNGYPPFPGAVDGIMNKIQFGSGSDGMESNPTSGGEFTGSIWSVGLKRSPLSRNIFNVAGCTNSAIATFNPIITAMKLLRRNTYEPYPITGWINGGNTSGGVDVHATYPTNFSEGEFAYWKSGNIVTGGSCVIKKIRIPLNRGLNFGSGYVFKIIVRDEHGSTQRTFTFSPLTNPVQDGKIGITIRPNGFIVENSFTIKIIWAVESSPTEPPPAVVFPIVINVEYLPDGEFNTIDT